MSDRLPLIIYDHKKDVYTKSCKIIEMCGRLSLIKFQKLIPEGNLLKLSCRISERLLLMIKACSIYFISVSKLYSYCGAMYGFVLSLGLVLAKRDFCFETKTRPSLSYKILEARLRLLLSRLESKARPLSNELESRARPLSNKLELTRDPRLWSRGHKSGDWCRLKRRKIAALFASVATSIVAEESEESHQQTQVSSSLSVNCNS